MRLAAVMLVVVTGCASPSTWKRTTGHRLDCSDNMALPILGTLVAAGAGAVMIGYMVATNDFEGDTAGLAGIPIAGAGILAGAFGAGAIVGFTKVERCRRVNDPARIEARRRALEVAHLTNEATQAARAGDCEAVRKLGVRVRDIAPWPHGHVFHNEPVIEACFAMPPRPPLAVPHCFDDAAEGETITICLPSKLDCDAATRMLPASDPPRTCVVRPAAPPAATP